MTAGGDPEAIRQHARRLRATADDVARTGDRVRAGAGVEWVGVAADRYRERLAEHAQRVTAAQDELLGTAGALDRLADELESRQAAIRRAMRFVEDRLDDARRTVGRLAGVADGLLTGAEQAARRAAHGVLGTVAGGLPTPGSPDWSGVADRIGRIR
ncbi:WXG100 family type VII secretion target [Cellulosimicrobium cellulans]|uniref:WXG100 family type VII secretion target n=1 Tax=Cellulosimicrobium cellulans TaxID=1710 RepID=UPI00130DF894|nr:WXG100 family type VII secretion target [Cellulosimicrobium cellulans]